MVLPTFTCFEPETQGTLVEGIQFHQYMFENASTCSLICLFVTYTIFSELDFSRTEKLHHSVFTSITADKCVRIFALKIKLFSTRLDFLSVLEKENESIFVKSKCVSENGLSSTLSYRNLSNRPIMHGSCFTQNMSGFYRMWSTVNIPYRRFQRANERMMHKTTGSVNNETDCNNATFSEWKA